MLHLLPGKLPVSSFCTVLLILVSTFPSSLLQSSFQTKSWAISGDSCSPSWILALTYSSIDRPFFWFCCYWHQWAGVSSNAAGTNGQVFLPMLLAPMGRCFFQCCWHQWADVFATAAGINGQVFFPVLLALGQLLPVQVQTKQT